MEFIFGDKNIVVDGNDSKKKSLLGGLSLVVLTRFAGIVFAISFRVTDTAAH